MTPSYPRGNKPTCREREACAPPWFGSWVREISVATGELRLLCSYAFCLRFITSFPRHPAI